MSVPTRRLSDDGGSVTSSEPAGTGGPRAQRRGADIARATLRGLGQVLITLGVVVLLFVVYEVYITDLFGARKQAAATAAIDQVWADAEATSDTVIVQSPDQLVTDPRQRTPTYSTALGDGFAKLYIPAFGADYVFTVVEGTDAEALYAGPGHYQDTQLPGQPGNFAVAGHRVSKGSPFNDLGLLESCDAVVVQTQDDWFVYRVLPMAEEVAGWSATPRANCDGVQVQTGAYENVFGREITVPADYAQVLPVPHVDSMLVPPDAQRLITLTTCHPQFSDAERMIVHGVLVRSYAKSSGFLPPELAQV
jgi:sortase A